MVMVLAGLISSDAAAQSGASYGEIGCYVDAAGFQGDSSNYYGAEAGMCFSPFRYTDLEAGFSIMNGNDQTFTFFNTRLGLFSPQYLNMRVIGGASVGIQISAPDDYQLDSDWPGRDEATGSWLLPYCGLEYLLRETDSGYSVRIHSRAAFTEDTVRRITVGIVLTRPV